MTSKKPAAPKTEVAAELAQKIDAHLKRIENDPTLNPSRFFDKGKKKWVLDPTGMGVRSYYGAGARGDRHRVWVIYITYQGGSYMTIEAAAKYLAWLDEGNEGRHFEALRVASL